MNILHTVEFYYPSSGGAQEAVKQLSERLVKLGHDVTVATTKIPERKEHEVNGVKIVEFDVHGNQVVGITGEVKNYEKFLVESDFDVMMNYAAQQWATDLAFEVLDQIKAKKVIVPCGYSALSNPDFKSYFASLPSILGKYDASVYFSNHYQDIAFARQHHLKNLRVIPNGADEVEFSQLIDRAQWRRAHNINGLFLVSVGNHTGAKGHRETLQAFGTLTYPATLAIIGHRQASGCFEECSTTAKEIEQSSEDKKILLLDAPRQEGVAALESADVSLLLSNVEASPIVLFESAASGVPFVASTAGNSAEIARWTHGGLIARSHPDPEHEGNVIVDIESVVKKINLLQKHSQLRRLLGRLGRRSWQRKFSWGKITEQYLALYEEILR